MPKIQIPSHLLPDAVPGAGSYLVDVMLRDGRTYSGLVVKDGLFITGRQSDLNGEGYLPFTRYDIYDLRIRSDMPGSLWQFWVHRSS